MMRATVLKSALAGFSLMFFMPLASAQPEGAAAPAEQVQTFNIPAGQLADALDALVAQSGIQLIYRDADVEGVETAGVSGETTVTAVLDVLLQETDLVVTRDASGAMAVGAPNGLGDGADPFAEGAATGAVEQARRAGVEEIIVTGQKKEERLQDVPIAISAFSMEDLDAQKIEGGFDLLKAIPNVTFSKTNFTSYNFQIRGVGTQSISAASDPGVAVSFNNIAVIQNRLFEQEYLDIERVEVLRGSQGTLYGRNATAGVVNLITAKPEFHESARLSLDAGNYNSQRWEGMANLPLVEDKAALRFAAAGTKRDGYVTNELTGQQIDGRDLWSTRLSLRVQPTDTFDVNLVWEHFNEDDDRLRSGKQLCKKDLAPDEIGGLPVTGSGGAFGLVLGQRRGGPDGPAGGQHPGHRGLGGGAVGQQGRGVHGVVPGVDARGGQRAQRLAGLGVLPDAAGGHRRLGRLGGEPLAVREHHGAHRRRDQQGGGDLEGQDVAGEQQVGQALDVAGGVGLGQAAHRAERDLGDGDEQQRAHPQPGPPGHPALAADRLHHRVGGVDADEHHDEEEEHQDRAGVDDDLDREEERRLEGQVEHREADHHHGQQQRRVHGLAHEQHAQRRGDDDGCEQPEGHGHACSPVVPIFSPGAGAAY